MHILHTSDWHLGKSLNAQPLIEDQKHFLKQLKDILVQANKNKDEYDALLIAGDIYDRPIPPKEAVLLLNDFLGEITALLPNLHVFIISGNHDSAQRLRFGSFAFEKNNIHICSDADQICQPFILQKNEEKMCIYQIPYLFPGTIEDDEKDLFTSQEEIVPILKSQQELFECALKKIKKNYNKNYDGFIKIVNAHLFAVGAKDGDIDYGRVGDSEAVNADIFDFFDYTALGHIHSFQKIGKMGNVFYSGSPFPYAFDEQNKKFFVDVKISKEKQVFTSKIPVNPLHGVKKISKNWDQLIGENADRDFIKECNDDYIQIILKDSIINSSSFELLKGLFPHLLSLKIEHNNDSSLKLTNERRKLLDSNIKNKAELIFNQFMKETDAIGNDNELYQKEKELFLEIAKKYEW